MSYMLHTVALSDIEDLVRYCDYPAMQKKTLNMMMFPNTGSATQEEEIMWHVSSFRGSLEKNPAAYFRKVCTNDGTPVGLALWTLDQPCLRVKRNGKQGKEEAVKVPKSLDTCAWREISQKLISERRRVIKDLENVWRSAFGLNVLSVSPAHQRRGCGSMLLAWGCEQADHYGRISFVMASPAAVGLYERFGYKTVGQVVTTHGTFRSMLRDPKSIEC
ncbi:hypothetical protein T440DRAFT_527121 [Plenodomus tracheiphilus IPT5]|uniref:N-acetyltransferase domain-containing protein n=1 Tax=Plenodomus tracheiphilus IPT5 TaxID=1408161 RepID=A0A6A7AMC3_9PLEO|nr:hypothetical protein T440DRAFT_527121 [Plenodomus tracheiphilus IPT5]